LDKRGLALLDLPRCLLIAIVIAKVP
jgi:hypothetical protein